MDSVPKRHSQTAPITALNSDLGLSQKFLAVRFPTFPVSKKLLQVGREHSNSSSTLEPLFAAPFFLFRKLRAK